MCRVGGASGSTILNSQLHVHFGSRTVPGRMNRNVRCTAPGPSCAEYYPPHNHLGGLHDWRRRKPPRVLIASKPPQSVRRALGSAPIGAAAGVIGRVAVAFFSPKGARSAGWPTRRLSGRPDAWPGGVRLEGVKNCCFGHFRAAAEDGGGLHVVCRPLRSLESPAHRDDDTYLGFHLACL